ncbi:uncharacterized protein N7446_013931 [Penicillium canescens]|uniref:Aldehyde dehydrogenase family 3 member A2 n=1 Tax=Penicillium canescens TaxID=5083 RepID=A0AAD6I0U6_PENCN|nr:uncharacterized protein N7446_013931 [Penicillium canescens]KAJ6023566.1 hypothetical protein N7460_013961 [Penicillium canescens]KAJ6025157.1 hypothetical protein N7444_012836 [Penicillium canescens]KAJ6042865.1 hypothetical protein N7446_013931 [Penicillium canescens]
MSLILAYQKILSAWVEGRLENVLQRQKELSSLHAIIKREKPALINALRQDLYTTEASASDEVISSLNAINQLYEELSFPATLAKERSIQAGKNAPTNLVPLGPVLILASPHCPLSSIIIPLAAAIAAGSCSLVVLNTTSLHTNEKLRKIIDTSLDQEAIGVAPEGKSWDNAELCSLCFGVAVLQNLESSSDVAASLRIVNPAIRIHAPSSGHPAVFVDRSTPDLEAVASIIADHVIQAPRKHTGRIPRICFVDEFIIDALAQMVHQILSERHTEQLNQVEYSELTQLIGNMFRISQQSTFTSPGSNDIANLIVVNKTSNVTADTVTKVAGTLTSHCQGALFIPTTSLDHGIDIWNKLNGGNASQATYIFAASRESFYLSHFLNSDHFFVNHIPSDTYGIVAPSSQYDSSELPFRREAFSINKSILQKPLHHAGTNNGSKVTAITSQLGYLNLNKIRQSAGGSMSYFEQGLIVGMASTVISLFAVSYVAFQGLKLLFH